MPRLLNKRRPFGIIVGEDPAFKYAAFDQDGSYYNHEGQPVEPATGKPLPIDNKVVKPQVVKKEGIEGDELPEEIDLAAWRLGKEKYPFFKVTSEISRRYAIAVHTKEEAQNVIDKETPVA